jgi:GDP-mannose transporter
MVFYNNFLSIGVLAPLCFISGEIPRLSDARIMTPYFILMNVAAGMLGFFLNFASLWCVSSTSATTYAIIGSFNKVPITILGYFLFHAKITNVCGIFIVMSTLGSFLYAYSKLPK